MTSLILFGLFVTLLIFTVPIAISLGIASFCAMLYSGAAGKLFMAQGLITSTDSFPLMAVPFFILAGELMGAGGLSRRLLQVASIICGQATGGLAMVTVAACMFFAAISGSGPATVAAIGSIMLPTMLKEGYDRNFTGGLLATAGSIGVIIPPSIPMVIYSISAEGVSASDMFLGGVIPGIMIGLGLMFVSWVISKRNNWVSRYKRPPLRECLGILNDAKWALFVPVLILGGIYGGIFTPTEAAAVAVIYGFVVGVFIYKDLRIQDVPEVVATSALTTASVLIIVGMATTFGRVLTIEQVPQQLVAFIASISTSTLVVMALINLLLLFVGCIMETLAAIIILAPILLPIAISVGVDPLHFGIIMVVNLAIGYVTPPVGANLFVTCAIANTTIEGLCKKIWPFILVMLVVLILITVFPQLSLFLPGLFK